MRRTFIAALVVSSLVVGAAPAFADQPIEDLILDGGVSDFRGRGVVLTAWGSDTAAAVFTVTRSQGMSMVTSGGGTLAVGKGSVARHDGESWYGTNVVASAPWTVSDRYSLGSDVQATLLDRSARRVTVTENGRPRIRITIDLETSVPLRTEVLDANGRVFRASFLTELSGAPAISGVQSRTSDPMPKVDVSKDMAHATASERLPASIDGYRRVDVYDAPDSGLQAFYTDGLFSFSVFEYGRTATPAAFEQASQIDLIGRRYRRIVEPSQVWLQWHAPDNTYLLVGDLPPDHLARVLPSLPAPGERAFLVRLWRRFFG